jgi:hypothetical protein
VGRRGRVSRGNAVGVRPLNSIVRPHPANVDGSQAVKQQAAVKDKNGALVRVGDFVRVVQIPDDVRPTKDEAPLVESMLGEVFQVEDIDPLGCAEVTKWWRLDKGHSRSQSLNLAAHEMERVERKRNEV